MIWLVGIGENVGGMSHLAKHIIIPACNLKLQLEFELVNFSFQIGISFSQLCLIEFQTIDFSLQFCIASSIQNCSGSFSGFVSEL